MEKRIIAYRKYMDELLEQLRKKEIDEGSGTEAVFCKKGSRTEKAFCRKEEISSEKIEKLKKEHLTQISFFQHERLIHLIVTVTFAVLEMLAVLTALLFPGAATLLLVVIVMALLLPYIRHYYILENEVQKMYAQYDRLNELG